MTEFEFEFIKKYLIIFPVCGGVYYDDVDENIKYMATMSIIYIKNNINSIL